MRLLTQKKEKGLLDWFFAVYISFLFGLGTIGNATNTKLGEVLWIDIRDFPGGSLAFYDNGPGGPYNLICNVTYVINSWFQDANFVYYHYCNSARS
jgi:hypothetical protein